MWQMDAQAACSAPPATPNPQKIPQRISQMEETPHGGSECCVPHRWILRGGTGLGGQPCKGNGQRGSRCSACKVRTTSYHVSNTVKGAGAQGRACAAE